ncbi:MAG: NEW3 domain-containing protein [Actinomycetota bacterium]
MNNRSKKIKTLVLTFLTIFTLSIIMSVPAMVFAQEEDEAVEPEPEPVPEELSFDISYPEIRAKAGEQFQFKADLMFVGTEAKTFDILWEAPEGWYVSVQPSYEQAEISAVKLEPGSTESLNIIAAPLVKMEPAEYDIEVIVEDEESGLNAVAQFKAIITATYELDLRTKTGRLNTEVTSGKDNKYNLIIENRGSASIENISISASQPEGWTVDFDNKEIETIESGETKEIAATIKPPEKTIAGDYMLTFNANSDNSTDSIDLRVTVLTPTVWGWVGIGIIVIVIVGVAIIFVRLGRR